MKKVFLTDKKPYFKANLHGHTTCSDGKKTPEEIKALYKAAGYSVFAFTDHERCIPHPELADSDFLPITGYELQVMDLSEPVKGYRKAIHLNFLAKDPEAVTLVGYSPEYIYPTPASREEIEALPHQGPDHTKRLHTAEYINGLIRQANELGFLAVFNHPTWSLESSGDWMALEGLWGMEIYNRSADIGGYTEAYCPYIYDDMLRSGQRVCCLAADDNHNKGTDPWHDDSFGGFCMINAERLDYPTIMGALERGDFYASRGPLIRELFFEDGWFHIECSPAARIRCQNGGRRIGTDNPDHPHASMAYPDEGKLLTSADFPLLAMDRYVRFTVETENGLTANTRAYYRDELDLAAGTSG